jgi:hypothetical protein
MAVHCEDSEVHVNTLCAQIATIFDVEKVLLVVTIKH